MKKISLIGRLILVGVVLMTLLAGCKKETVDMTDLLRTVPSSAAGVVVFNMESLLQDAGCKVKDHVVTPGAELTALIEKTSLENRKEIMQMFNGDTGIEPKGAVVFYDSNRAYLTFALYDVSKFCNMIETRNGSKFVDETGNVRVCGNVAVKGSQAWICISPNRRLDPDGISAYANLASSQSFLVTPIGEKLMTEENDVRGWGMTNTFLDEMMSRSERNIATMGLGFIFEDAASICFKIDFKEGEMEAEASMLNEKGKPAKYLLSSDKIDVKTLKSLGSTCDAMMAFTVNSKLIKKFDQLGSLMGGALFGDVSENLKNVDGTVGLVASPGDVEESINGVVTTKGELAKSLKDLISKSIAPISEDGKYLRFSKGDVKGELSVEECAEELKGCCVGLVLGAPFLNTSGTVANMPKSIAVKLKPESGSLELEIEMKTSDPKQNALLSILSNGNSF